MSVFVSNETQVLNPPLQVLQQLQPGPPTLQSQKPEPIPQPSSSPPPSEYNFSSRIEKNDKEILSSILLLMNDLASSLYAKKQITQQQTPEQTPKQITSSDTQPNIQPLKLPLMLPLEIQTPVNENMDIITLLFFKLLKKYQPSTLEPLETPLGAISSVIPSSQESRTQTSQRQLPTMSPAIQGSPQAQAPAAAAPEVRSTDQVLDNASLVEETRFDSGNKTQCPILNDGKLLPYAVINGECAYTEIISK
jgi:hypothetical protein